MLDLKMGFPVFNSHKGNLIIHSFRVHTLTKPPHSSAGRHSRTANKVRQPLRIPGKIRRLFSFFLSRASIFKIDYEVSVNPTLLQFPMLWPAGCPSPTCGRGHCLASSNLFNFTNKSSCFIKSSFLKKYNKVCWICYKFLRTDWFKAPIHA